MLTGIAWSGKVKVRSGRYIQFYAHGAEPRPRERESVACATMGRMAAAREKGMRRAAGGEDRNETINKEPLRTPLNAMNSPPPPPK